MKMKINQPRCLIPGSSADMNAEFPACLEKLQNSTRSNLLVDSVDVSNGYLFQFPEVSSTLGLALSRFTWNNVCFSFCLFICFLSFCCAACDSWRGNNLLMASVAACGRSRKHLPVYINILWNGKFIKWHEIPYSTNALRFGGRFPFYILQVPIAYYMFFFVPKIVFGRINLSICN